MTKQKEKETIVIVKCIGCGAKKEIRAGEIAKNEMPMCDVCFNIMIAEKALTK